MRIGKPNAIVLPRSPVPLEPVIGVVLTTTTSNVVLQLLKPALGGVQAEQAGYTLRLFISECRTKIIHETNVQVVDFDWRGGDSHFI